MVSRRNPMLYRNSACLSESSPDVSATFTTVAFDNSSLGGLRSAPDCRPRRTSLHLSYSCAAPFGPAMLVTQDPNRTNCASASCDEKRRLTITSRACRMRPSPPHHRPWGASVCVGVRLHELPEGTKSKSTPQSARVTELRTQATHRRVEIFLNEDDPAPPENTMASPLLQP